MFWVYILQNPGGQFYINQAIEDTFRAKKGVFFPGGTYIVSDTIKAFKWMLMTGRERGRKDGRPQMDSSESHLSHTVIGSFRQRPVIKLADNASLFDDAANPRPIIAFRLLKAKGPGVTISDPLPPLMEDNEKFALGTTSLFEDELRNIDVDCDKPKGAIGVYFPAAQNCSIINVGPACWPPCQLGRRLATALRLWVRCVHHWLEFEVKARSRSAIPRPGSPAHRKSFSEPSRLSIARSNPGTVAPLP